MQERHEKENIRKELLGLADKVRYMENTYRREIQQSQKIKDELFKFWEHKEKKDSVIKELHPSKTLNEIKLNGNENSQTTISIS